MAGLTRVPAAQISWKRLERLCAIYPPLEATIVVSIDESDLSATSVSAETITAVQGIIDDLFTQLRRIRHDEAVAEQDSPSMKATQSEGLLHQLKAFKGVEFNTLDSLWHPTRGVFIDVPDEWAELLLADASSR